jgi:hypothetical protein
VKKSELDAPDRRNEQHRQQTTKATANESGYRAGAAICALVLLQINVANE